MLALGLQSCQEQDDVLVGSQYPILFRNTQTRAVADIDDLKTDGFKVHAYYERGNVTNTFEKNVTYQSTQDVWGYGSPEYWVSGAEYWFQAFYPSTSSAYTLNVNNKKYTITGLDITEQVDIMAASTNCKVNEGAMCPEDGSVVNLAFDHLLTCVVLELRSSVPDVTINKLILKGVAATGSYVDGTWSSSGTVTLEHASGVSLDNVKYVDVTKGGILVIPEDIDGSSQTLTVKASNKDYYITFPVGTWVKGKKYTYKAEIKQSDIIFADSPDVDEWDSESATGSVIIK